MDYNGDGLLDFVAGGLGIYPYINKGNYTFDAFYLGQLDPFDDLTSGGMTSFDINQDGKEDLITGGVSGMIRFFINNFSQLPPLRPFIFCEDMPHYGMEYEYTIYTKDINGDDIYYFVDWGDGNSTGWIGPYKSGEEITLNHTWYVYGAYKIRVVAKDTNGLESRVREKWILILRDWDD